MRRIAPLAVAAALCIAAPAGRAAPADDPWADYHIIMWQAQNAAQYATLKRIGVDAGRAIWRADGERDFASVVAPFRAAGIGWYAENIATDFYAPYHRWTPGQPVNWRFLEARRRYEENPSDRTAFVREPGLSDPVWLARVRDRLTRVVQASRPYPALFYNLADEPGIADLGAHWDFDLSDSSLAVMRGWLKEQYGTLAALNRQWGTRFANWDAVRPMTTAEAVARRDENFSAWADFKTWMDEAFARALRAGTDAVHAANPRARAGIEGGQIPGWGGYDYTRLAGAVDVMELYDNGDNVEIVRSLAPKTVLLSTLYGTGPAAEHRVWRALLKGGRGLILWDPAGRFVRADGAPGPRAKAFAPLFRKLRGGLGALLIASERRGAPVAMLYSPPSFRIRWLLDIRRSGEDWSTRSNDTEYRDNAIRAARHAFGRAIARLGLHYRFVSPEQLAGGALERDGERVLILPHAIALSDAEARAVRRFAAAGGTVIADTPPGAFDEHGRRRKDLPLAGLFPSGQRAVVQGNGRALRVAAAGRGERGLTAELARIFADAGIRSKFRLTLPDRRRPREIDLFLYRHGTATIVAVQRRQAGRRASTAVTLAVPPGSYVTDLMAERPLGRMARLDIALGPAAPAIYAVSPRPLVAPEIKLPAALHPGEAGAIHVRRDGAGPGRRPIRIEISDPRGHAVPELSGTLLLTGNSADWPLRLGADAPPGTWRVRATDILSAAVRRAEIAVSAR